MRTLMTSALLPTTVVAQGCDSILRDGIWELYDLKSVEAQQNQFAHWACNKASTSGSVSYAGIGVGGASLRSSCSADSGSYECQQSARLIGMIRTKEG